MSWWSPRDGLRKESRTQQKSAGADYIKKAIDIQKDESVCLSVCLMKPSAVTRHPRLQDLQLSSRGGGIAFVVAESVSPFSPSPLSTTFHILLSNLLGLLCLYLNVLCTSSVSAVLKT